ncbi:hypothetical protein PAHAL_5G345800 [Panicum hallii]|uniref:Uncharacterized protein n=1 Tax=Panicum hallii TaxID=206008 RepID=A0A2T8IM65_9POAL|nr:hypothetical protein PAHAL_5G345800 [Panicum hallii]
MRALVPPFATRSCSSWVLLVWMVVLRIGVVALPTPLAPCHLGRFVLPRRLLLWA